MDFGEFVKLLQHLGLVSEVRGTTGIVPKDQAAQIFKQVNLHTAEEEADDGRNHSFEDEIGVVGPDEY